MFDVAADGHDGLGGVLGAHGGLFDAGGDLFGGCGGAFQPGGLAFGAHGQVVRGDGQFARAGPDRFGAVGHGAEGLAQAGGGGVEIVLQRRVFGREVGLDRDAEVAFGQRLQRLAQGGDHLGLAGLGLGLGGGDLIALDRQGVQIGGDGQVHVQQGALVQLGQGLARLTVVGGAGEGLARAGRHRLDQLAQQHAVAADVPARLQADAGVGAADGGDGAAIVLVDPPVDNGVPVSDLGGPGAGHMGVVMEEAPRFGGGADTVVKGVQGARRGGAQDVLHGPVGGRRLGQSGEGCALLDRDVGHGVWTPLILAGRPRHGHVPLASGGFAGVNATLVLCRIA